MDLKSIDWKNLFFTFQGRVDRRVMIAYVIILILVAILASILTVILGPSIGRLVMLIVNIPLVWAGIAVAIKRFHDMGKSGWLTLIYLIPLVGLGVLVWQCIAESEGPNAYGALPATI